MNKQIQNSTQLSIRVLIMCVIATMALFFFSCKKKKLTPSPVATETYYTVTFNSKDGTKINAIKVKKGNTITLPANPTKADFVFGGWFTDDNTFKNQFDAKTPITADITLYAKWDLPDYTVTFDSKGGSEVKAVKVKKGGTITLPPDPTKTDFVFAGWFTDDNTFKNQFDAKTVITANLTLYAKWDVPEYTVTFDSKGGSEVKAVKVKKGGAITLPANPTKVDFAFGGWFTDDNTFKNKFDATTPITANITLYAKWDVQEYTVTFDSKGGSVVNAITNVKKGSTITLPPNPTKAGFTFDGWYTDDNTFKNQFDAKTPVTADITLYAKWNAVAPASFSLSSASFDDGGEIPPKHAYSIGGQPERLNVSPQLSWANAPAATTSFLIIMEDLDVRNYAHWTAYNIPADKTSVTEAGYRSKDPSQLGSRLGNKYEGPWPPPGVTHTYQITVFALDLPTTHFSEANFPVSKAEAGEKLGAHILASAFIKGTFTSK